MAVTGLQNNTVNHLVNFVEPGGGAYTNAIDNLWKCARDKFKQMHDMSDAHVTWYPDEFMWHRMYSQRDACFHNAVEMMHWRYPVCCV